MYLIRYRSYSSPAICVFSLFNYLTEYYAGCLKIPAWLITKYVLYYPVDMNECDLGITDICHEYASCTNTNGSYICTCDVGYTGSGQNCTGMLRWWAGCLGSTSFGLWFRTIRYWAWCVEQAWAMSNWFATVVLKETILWPYICSLCSKDKMCTLEMRKAFR